MQNIDGHPCVVKYKNGYSIDYENEIFFVKNGENINFYNHNMHIWNKCTTHLFSLFILANGDYLITVIEGHEKNNIILPNTDLEPSQVSIGTPRKALQQLTYTGWQTFIL